MKKERGKPLEVNVCIFPDYTGLPYTNFLKEPKTGDAFTIPLTTVEAKGTYSASSSKKAAVSSSPPAWERVATVVGFAPSLSMRYFAIVVSFSLAK